MPTHDPGYHSCLLLRNTLEYFTQLHGLGARIWNQHVEFGFQPRALRMCVVRLIQGLLESAQVTQFAFDGRIGQQLTVFPQRRHQIPDRLVRILERLARVACLLQPPQSNDAYAFGGRTVQGIGQQLFNVHIQRSSSGVT